MRFSGDPTRREHDAMRARMGGLELLMRELGPLVPAACMRRVLRFLHRELIPHMEEEERSLYPRVDRASGGSPPITAVLRREHRILLRWIVHLEAAAERGEGIGVFAQRAENLMGMLYAHMEVEEAMLLPLVDGEVEPGRRRRRARGDLRAGGLARPRPEGAPAAAELP
jgi:iron-sulfur cluster repair protein YtfE (RIC family)